MVRTITDEGGNEFTLENVGTGWGTKAEAALAQIDDAITTLEGSPGTQDVIDELVDAYQLLSKIIKAIWYLAELLGLE